MFYAQLNEENICVVVSQLSDKIEVANMIEIKDFDVSLLGKKYNNGAWEEVIQPEPTPEPLSPTEQAILQTAINTEYMMSIMETTI